MAISGSAVYLSSILLEKNRFNGKGPSFLVSEWIEDIAEAGFAGLEIWMNHLSLASRSEWDLIKARAAETDLPIPLISAGLPSDASDKSRRYLDSVIEACEYFRPDGLKFSLGDPSRPDALEHVKSWARDLPRDIALIYDGGESVIGPEAMAGLKKTLGGRFHAVLRPFLAGTKEAGAIMDATGDFIANFGVQARKGGARILLSENADAHLEVIAAMRSRGFKGAWTLEFTKGAGLPGENIEQLFDNAEKDLNFLTEAPARSGLAGSGSGRPKPARRGHGKE